MQYKFGVTKYHQFKDRKREIGICSCGQVNINFQGYYYTRTKFQCEKCGNENFLYIKNIYEDRNGYPRFIFPYVSASRKDNRGFKALRVNLSVIYKPDLYELIIIKENMKREIDYDIIDKRLKIWKNGVLEYEYNPEEKLDLEYLKKLNSMFFSKLDQDIFINIVANETTRELFTIAKKLGRINYNYWKYHENLIHGFIRLTRSEGIWLQILSNAGIPNLDRFVSNNGTPYNCVDISKTKPHEILKVPKFMLSYIREDDSMGIYTLRDIQSLVKDRKIDVNKIREMLSIVKDEGTLRDLANSAETIMTLHIDYGYDNLRKLTLYLFREVKLTQGITTAQNASILLRDYVRMSRAMELEYEKYPKSLKKVHDVVSMNYDLIQKDERNIKEFLMSIEKPSYKELVFENKKEKYKIITPSQPKDLVKEGNELSHCVASYVKDVVADRCKILFLRDKEEVEKPLVTIEVRGLNIRQARGYANRSVTNEQKEFIKKWAEEKGLVEAYY